MDIEEKVEAALGVNDSEIRNFNLVQADPPIYVYIYQPEEQRAASSVSISAWDKFANIRMVDILVPNTECGLDLLPFFQDNVELLEMRDSDELLVNVVQRKVTECKSIST